MICDAAIATNTTAHISVSSTLARLNREVFQYFRCTSSRAYCSVNGWKASDATAKQASAPTARPLW